MKNTNQSWVMHGANSALHDLYAQLGECDYLYIRCSRELEILEQRRNEILNQIENCIKNGNNTNNNENLDTDNGI